MTTTKFFNSIQEHWDKELPFVMYSYPSDQRIFGRLVKNDQLYLGDDFENPGFVFGPFSTKNHQTIWFPDSETTFVETSNEQKGVIASGYESASASSEVEKRHINLVNDALLQLKTGNLKKVVISRCESQDVSDITPVLWFKRMLQQYSNTFCYCWYHPKIGMWLGASPETLVNLKENLFETMALAGTMPFQGNKEVSWGAKEKEEQQFVVDSMLSILKPIVSEVVIKDTETQKAGSLVHLKTPISGVLKHHNQLKVLVESLHPTSAVCGLPKEISKKYILNNEGYDRSYYTGYLGVFNPAAKTHLFVNLRCMQVEKNTVKIYVGGGVTALSNAEQEWQETVNKSKIMKSIL